MTTRPISMSKLHSILRLKYSAQLSHREIARSLNISPGTVANYLKKANELGLNQWPIPEDKQQNTFFNTKLKRFSTRKKRHSTPVRNTMMPIAQYHSSRSLFCLSLDLSKI